MESCTLSSNIGPLAKDVNPADPCSSSMRPRTPILAWSNKLHSSSSAVPVHRGESSTTRSGERNRSKENQSSSSPVPDHQRQRHYQHKGSSSNTKHITRVHIRKKDQSTKSAGAVLASSGKDKNLADSEVGRRPVKRFSRVHVITDKERASNIEADKLSADIRLPREWPASWSLQKAQRQNRTIQNQLSVRLECIDKGLLVQFNKIANSERRLLKEFLSKYPEMYEHVMSGVRDKGTIRKLGIFPPPRTHDGVVPLFNPSQVQQAEAAVIRAHLKPPGGGEFPLLRRKRLQVVTPSSPTRKSHRDHESNSPQVGIHLTGVRVNEREPPIKENTIKEKDLSGFSPAKQGASFITNPDAIMAPSARQAVNVSYFVDTDFGYQQDRQRQTITGMSLQKDIQDKTQLEKDIEKVAQKHINAMTTSGLNHRSSRKMEGAENLRSTFYKSGRQRMASDRGLTSRGTPLPREYSSVTPTKALVSPRGRRKLKSGGPLPPLEKDVSKVVVVGSSDGPLVADANKAIAANDNLSFCEW